MTPVGFSVIKLHVFSDKFLLAALGANMHPSLP